MSRGVRCPGSHQPLALFARAASHGSRIAIVEEGGSYSYRDLLDASARVAARLLADHRPLDGARIAILLPPGFHFVAALWGIWRAGGIAVPLALAHPPAELAFVLDDTQVSCVLSGPELESRIREARVLRIEDVLATGAPAEPATHLIDPTDPTLPIDRIDPIDPIDPDQGATILYTSGTTGKPKGVVTSHRNLQAQIDNLVAAWRWSRDDRILQFLPLHHVHGLVNIVGCALWSGAVCEVLPRFDAGRVWQAILSGRLTLLMAVPTIYVRLIKAWEEADAGQREALSKAAAGLRLMVSGSAALPVPVLERWQEITGHVLLERYGMTEIGMALSNPYDGPRVPGAVGSPLPGVEVRLVDEDGRLVASGQPGEIEVRGPTVFRHYWQRPEATREGFRDGCFRTGDLAIVEDGVYRILGRQSVDIIKCGGEKISALEIETALLGHPRIEECAVVGLEDAEWGQRVAAALVLTDGGEMDLETLRTWARERLAIFKVPSRVKCLDRLPRNAMGKVTKPAVVEAFGEPG